MFYRERALVVASTLLLFGCTFAACAEGESATPSTSSPPAEAAGSSAPARPRVVVLGDSLTAGLGLPLEQAFPALLQTKIDDAGYNLEVVNAGVSGDTSAGALRRLDWALEGNVRILIVALGANDGLRGLAVEEMTRNIAHIIEQARGRQVAVLLAGMEAPPNFGPMYTAAFRQAYRDLAARQPVVFVPFLLDGIAGRPDLNQSDGIHPNAAGARVIADRLWPRLQPMLDAATTND